MRKSDITESKKVSASKHKAIPHNSKCRYGERGAADAVPQLPERCLSRKAGIVRCCLNNRCANRAAAFLPFAAADLLAQQNRGAHGKAADQVCQRHHDLRAGSCPTKMAG